MLRFGSCSVAPTDRGVGDRMLSCTGSHDSAYPCNLTAQILAIWQFKCSQRYRGSVTSSVSCMCTANEDVECNGCLGYQALCRGRAGNRWRPTLHLHWSLTLFGLLHSQSPASVTQCCCALARSLTVLMLATLQCNRRVTRVGRLMYIYDSYPFDL